MPSCPYRKTPHEGVTKTEGGFNVKSVIKFKIQACAHRSKKSAHQKKVVCFFKTENSEEMMKMIRPALWLLERYNHPYYLVYTNTPGEIVYEDQYQVVVRVPGVLQIEKLQPSWTPEDK